MHSKHRGVGPNGNHERHVEVVTSTTGIRVEREHRDTYLVQTKQTLVRRTWPSIFRLEYEGGERSGRRFVEVTAFPPYVDAPRCTLVYVRLHVSIFLYIRLRMCTP
jgi:hypothetical protein